MPKSYVMPHLVASCRQAGVKNVVISPGSRSAPLSLAFARAEGMTMHTSVHEGSASFFAFGLACYTGNIVVLICTSGSAGLHYAPGIAEAFYQKVPLLILTADRPPEWIDQQDGQTLSQSGIYGKLVKHSYNFPDLHPEGKNQLKDQLWHAKRTVNDALKLCLLPPQGPVHINIPLRPPLYRTESQDEPTTHPQTQTIFPYQRNLLPQAWKSIQNLLEKYPKVLVLCGQGAFDKNLLRKMKTFCSTQQIPMLGDILSNCHEGPELLRHGDKILKVAGAHKRLRPDLLISFGGALLSKATKTFLRTYAPKVHLRLEPNDLPAPDPLQCLTHQVPLGPAHFFAEGTTYLRPVHAHARRNFLKRWQEAEKEASQTSKTRLKSASFGQLKAMKYIFEALPNYANIHLGNSMPVRYANYIGLRASQGALETYANRGVCGIDGCVSSAMGIAAADPSVLNVLLVGDLSFLHDQGAWLNTVVPKNFRVIIFNDHGGGIFRLLPGTTSEAERESYFVMPQMHNLLQIASAYRLTYKHISNENELKDALTTCFSPSTKAQIIEITTNPEVDHRIFEDMIKTL